MRRILSYSHFSHPSVNLFCPHPSSAQTRNIKSYTTTAEQLQSLLTHLIIQYTRMEGVQELLLLLV